MKYILIPFISWAASGSLKVFINFLRLGRIKTGYGGFPSTHTAILSGTTFFCGFSGGFNTPIFSLGLAVMIIVIFDAHGLRRKLNIGHSWAEISAGLILGIFVAYFVNLFG